MMTYELMTQGVSCGFFIESREVRGFDTHYSRRSCLSTQGQQNQLANITRNLWSPLKALVHRLKTTPYGTTGYSYWDLTTITLCSEMGRMVGADAGPVLSTSDDDATKYDNIMTQDVCQHWHVSSAAFLGGKVKGNTQWGRVGTRTLNPIPILQDGTLDPAFDPVTGDLLPGQNPSTSGAVTDCGSVYATSLYLADLDPVDLKRQGKGKNESPPLTFVKKA
jgi:hypothetical protein